MTTTSPKEIRRILIVEDDAKYAGRLKSELTRSGKFQVVGSVESFDAGIASARKLRPDLVLFDLVLQSVDQTDRIFRLKEASPSLVVVMTAFPDRDRIFRALLAGADGYVWKSGSPAPVLDAIDEITAQGFPLSRDVAQAIRKHFHEQGVLARKYPLRKLSVRQKQIVDLVCEGLKNSEIAERLRTTEETVKADCKQIFRKLDVPNRARIGAVVGQFIRAFKPSE